ncbi:MAG TPA: DUF2147 domain-containing protein [Allosphingosinicella sp.]
MRPFPIALLPLLAASTAATAAPGSIRGLWLNDDHTGLVRIESCGAKLCGTIAKVLNPGAPKTDIHNPDSSLQHRPILGLRVLSGFEGSGGSWKGGRAYDPKSGKSYKSYLQLEPDGSLKVSGCILFVCESRRWTRAH